MQNEIDILGIQIGGMTLREMSAITFIQWLAGKLNGVEGKNSDIVELVARVSNPPLGRMLDEEKIAIVEKLKRIGVQLP